MAQPPGANLPAGPVLSFNNIVRRFGDFVAVDSVNFDLARGEILTLLGPSGCGKTTTLRMAIGLERSDGGCITYRGKPVDKRDDRIFVPPEKRDMGMVFQSYAIWPHMSVAENVGFPLRARGVGKADVAAKVGQFLGLVGLGAFGERSGMQLSGGQQQRVAVARGLVAEPDVLLMDEPFSNLDAKLRDQMRIEIKILQRRLRTSVLFVTHDQTEALALSDRIAVMRAGRIEQIGPPEELYSRPATPFVRDFLGQTILLDGEVLEARAGKTVRVRGPGGIMLTAEGANHMSAAEPGCACRISIRPEEAEISHVASEEGAENRITATVRTLLFLGAQYEAVVELPGGLSTTLHLPRSRSWREGQQIDVLLPAQHLQLWDMER